MTDRTSAMPSMVADAEIRRYGAGDRDRLKAIWRAASEQAHSFFTAEQLDAQEQIVGDIYLPEAETWVMVVGADPVGFIGLIDQFIGGLFVDPSAHGRGIGRRLIAHAQSLKGVLELEVYAENQRAMRFYKRLGFEEIGRRAIDDNGLPFEVVRLRLSKQR